LIQSSSACPFRSSSGGIKKHARSFVFIFLPNSLSNRSWTSFHVKVSSACRVMVVGDTIHLSKILRLGKSERFLFLLPLRLDAKAVTLRTSSRVHRLARGQGDRGRDRTTPASLRGAGESFLLDILFQRMSEMACLRQVTDGETLGGIVPAQRI